MTSPRTPDRRALAALLAGTAAYTWFFTAGLPFYFEDLNWIDRTESSADLLAATVLPAVGREQHGIFERPFETLCLRLIKAAFGYAPWAFRTFKAAALAGTAAVLYALLRRAGTPPGWSAAAAGFFVVSLPVLQSTAWICDFEIVAQLFVTALFAAFLRAWSTGLAPSWLVQAALVVLGTLANASKGSARIVPAVLLLFVVLRGASALRRWALVIGVLGVAAALPSASAATGLAHGYRASQVLAFGGQLVAIAGWPLVVAAVGALGWALREGVRPAADPARDASLLCGLWALAAVLLWGVLPSAETRYLVGAVLPLVACTAFVLHRVLSRLERRRFAAAALAVLLTVQVGVNLRYAMHWRAMWGEQFVAAARCLDLVEQRWEDALVVYEYWRPLFYPIGPTRNRWTRAHPEELAKVGASIDEGGALRVPRGTRAVLMVSLHRDAQRTPVAACDGRAGTLYDAVAEATGWTPRFMPIGGELELGAAMMRPAFFVYDAGAPSP